MRVGVLGAMPEEVSAVIAMLGSTATIHAGKRDFVQGTYATHEIVAVHSRIGKVAAASAALELIVRFNIDQLIFTGLAGALIPELSHGDIVIAEGLIQHDMDASPLFPPLEVPLTGCSRFPTTPAINNRLTEAVQSLIECTVSPDGSTMKQGTGAGLAPKLVRGDITSGDQFIADSTIREHIRARVPSAVCVEMEGAAVAQVCQEYGTPFGVFRSISDGADSSAAADFSKALAQTEATLAAAVVRQYLTLL